MVLTRRALTQQQLISRVVKPAFFALALVPFGLLLRDGFMEQLGANPVEEITHRTGDWTLYFLLATLAITPLRRLTGLNQLIKMRRMVGLFAFFYACLHLFTYLVIDLVFYLPEIAEDIVKRPYITVGFTAFLILTALAVTSPIRMVKKLGGRTWNKLHRLIYVAGALGVLHYLWLVKADTSRPVVFGLVLVGLLAFRIKLLRGRDIRFRGWRKTGAVAHNDRLKSIALWEGDGDLT